MLLADHETETEAVTTPDIAEPTASDSIAAFEPRTQRSGVSGEVRAPICHHDNRASDPPERLEDAAPARPFKVDEVAPEFYEQALVLWHDQRWNSAQLFREFTRRYGLHAVSRSSFYRWVEVRLVDGRPPDPLAPLSRTGGSVADGPNPRDLVNLDADPPEFQSRVILDMALRLARSEIDLLDAQLAAVKSAGSITLPETVLLRAVRARQSHDRTMEREALFWVI